MSAPLASPLQDRNASLVTMSGELATPSRLYRQGLTLGLLWPDGAQEALLPGLDHLAEALRVPVKRVVEKGVEVWRSDSGEALPKGYYIYGDVGRGKSQLMQMLFDSVPMAEKRRVHFHPFMEELHKRMFHARPPKGVDLMMFMASELSAEARLLCFDEFYITTIADGMLLGRLLEALFFCGVTLCATSNWEPDQLFQDGFNRSRVLPFIAMLKKRLHVAEVGHGVDWRRSGGVGEVSHTADELFAHLSGSEARPESVVLKRTKVSARGAENGVYWFGFQELCTTALGRAEYMNLCDQAEAVIISGLPKLTPDGCDAAMRFVVLVDLLYENRVPLQVFSHVELDQVCTDGPAAFAWRRSMSRVHELSRHPRFPGGDRVVPPVTHQLGRHG